MIYLDTSAMVKLVVAEQESVDLIDWLNERVDSNSVGTDEPAPLATSTIGRIELMRTAMRSSAAVVAAARLLLDTVDTLILTDSIAKAASTFGPPELRTLDAIHLATADAYRQSITALCAYDHRLLAAARAHDLPVASPGRS